jgi:hypothetical protein
MTIRPKLKGKLKQGLKQGLTGSVSEGPNYLDDTITVGETLYFRTPSITHEVV